MPLRSGGNLTLVFDLQHEDKRARQRAKEKGRPAAERKAPSRLVEGQVVTNWKQALAQLAIVYPDRINPHL